MNSQINITGARLPKLLLVLALMHFSFSSLAQSAYSVNWHQIPGGGGVSSGGAFTLSGSIGQHDASRTMSGGGYQLTGGFWSILAVVQTPGAPLLTISQAGNQIVVSWPAVNTGWTLQTNTDLTTQTWGNYNNAVVNNAVTNPPAQGRLFFRLKQ